MPLPFINYVVKRDSRDFWLRCLWEIHYDSWPFRSFTTNTRIYYYDVGLAPFCCWSKWKWKCLWRRSECSKMGFIDCSSWGLVPHFSIHIQRNGNIVTNFIFIRCHTYSPIDCPIILDITFKWNCTYRCSENRLWSYYRH